MANARAALDSALYAHLNVHQVLNAVPGGVHNTEAPAGTAYPLVIYQAMSKVDEHTFDGRFARAVYLVKVTARAAWPKAAVQAYAEVHTVLQDAALSVTGYTLLQCRRQSTFALEEQDGGELYQHVGGLYLIQADEA